MHYSKELGLNEAYRLIDAGPTVFTMTSSKNKEYNIVPIAWASPARIAPTRVIICIGKRHKSFTNLLETKEFAVGVPHISQLELVKQTGTTLGVEINKYKEFNIESISAKIIDAKIPTGMIGYMECKICEVFDTGNLAIVMGDVVYAAVNPEAYNGKRLLSETEAGKTVHHLGDLKFITTGDKIYEL